MASPQYITIADLSDAYDVRDLKALTSDTGAEATLDSSNTELVTAIEAASSEFLRSCLAGNLYTAEDIQTLATADDWTVKSIVVKLAIVHLHRRRAGKDLPADVKAQKEEADEILDQLRRGLQVLPDDDTAAATLPSEHFMSKADREQLGLVSDGEYFEDRRVSGS